MKPFRAALCFLGMLLALPATAAPKNVILSDSLLANADRWNVKQGAELLGKSKWRFGDYAIEAKRGWTTGRTGANFWKTKTESRTARQFSLILSNQTDDSAFVHAAHEVTSRSNPGLNLGHGTSIGGDGRTVEVDRFLAFIALNRDTAEWALAIGARDVSDRHGDLIEGEAVQSATLTSGDRRIVLTPVFSKKFDRDKPPSFGAQLSMSFHPPAMGFEFAEDGRSLCAVEYFSEGLAGSHKNVVWMNRNADPRLKLVLAAAMTAVMQMESAVINAPAEPEHP